MQHQRPLLGGVELGGTNCVCVIGTGPDDVRMRTSQPTGSDPAVALSGIEAALLSEYASDWNLIIACDMPRISAELFRNLAAQASNGADCIVPKATSGKLQPLCALYKKSCGPPVTQALTGGTQQSAAFAIYSLGEARFRQEEGRII